MNDCVLLVSKILIMEEKWKLFTVVTGTLTVPKTHGIYTIYN
uniref:Uncharacterized protein n=1 Tax=Anguilla anguilla TaxID=7936 RepID=A0A0E9WXI7_ANGAN